ncbi:MAG TPA: hypothetical protein VN669_07975 [Candidatus Acidoferrales bacterium]|nr:hypothetical protein [Candidatus Acidoferrales bacterium]
MRATAHLQFMLKTALQQGLVFVLCLILPPLITVQGQAATAPAQASLNSLAADFVHEMIARAGLPHAASVSFQNISVLPPDLQESVQNAIFTALRNAGIQMENAGPSPARIEITFSEDWQGYVWIASIQQGGNRKVVMQKVARPEHVTATRAPMLTIRKSTVWLQASPILDFFQDGHTLALLEPDQVSVYTSDSGQWRLRYVLGITHAQPWPRDLRGRLVMNGSQVSVFLPGTRCSGSTSPPTLDCHAGDDPWPVDQGGVVGFYSPRRNFFTGLLAGPSAGASVVPFFSAAAWQTGDTHQWLFSGTDGRTRLYQYDLSAPAAVFNGWGSNMAAVHSSCGSGWQALVSAPTDSVRPDSVQAVEVLGREALPVSAPIDLAGPVQALWAAGKNGDAVNGVLKSPTGQYEAFTLTVNCSR